MGLTTAQAFGETRSLLGSLKQQNQLNYAPADKAALGRILQQVESAEARRELRQYMRDHLGVYFQYAGTLNDKKYARDALSLGNALNLSRLTLKDWEGYLDAIDWLSVYPTTSQFFFSSADKLCLPRLKGLMLQNVPFHAIKRIPPCDILFMIYTSTQDKGDAPPFRLPSWLDTNPPKLIVWQSDGQGFRWDSPVLGCDVLNIRFAAHRYDVYKTDKASMTFKAKGQEQADSWAFKFEGSYPDFRRTAMRIPEPEDFSLKEGNAETFSQMRERYFPFVYRNVGEGSTAKTWRHALRLFG